MVHKIPSPIEHCIRINFSIPSSVWADKITLVGDFNDWNHRAHPLKQTLDGTWHTALDLPKDKQYEFRYWVDGQWITDYHADGFSTAAEGLHNGVVHT